MEDDETSKEKRCRTCQRLLTLGDKPDRCAWCISDDWAKKHFARYCLRHLGSNRAARRQATRQQATRQQKHERRSAR